MITLVIVLARNYTLFICMVHCSRLAGIHAEPHVSVQEGFLVTRGRSSSPSSSMEPRSLELVDSYMTVRIGEPSESADESGDRSLDPDTGLESGLEVSDSCYGCISAESCLRRAMSTEFPASDELSSSCAASSARTPAPPALTTPTPPPPAAATLSAPLC